MNIVWVSANEFGHRLLDQALKIDKSTVSAVITLHPESSTKMYDGVPLSAWEKFNLPVFCVKNINSEVKLVRKLSPDLLIVCGWRQIIGNEILTIPKCGSVGFHPTLLPFGRGPAPIINSILRGVRKSGVTMFYLTEGLDEGDIIGQENFSIMENDHASEVYKKAISAGKKLIANLLPELIKGVAPRIPQDHKRAVIFKKPKPYDNRLDPGKDSLDLISRKIRAYSHPYDGAYLEKDNRHLLIWRSEMLKI